MATLTLDGHACETVHLATAGTNILLVQAAHGFVGCGYFDIAVAERVGDAAAIVTGVKSIEQLLAAPVVRLSTRARERGVREGMTGREALRCLA